MAFTLVVNPGSSSKKYALYFGDTLKFSAHIERNETGYELCTTLSGVQQKCESLPAVDYQTSLRNFLTLAETDEVITSVAEISTIAIRVVAPGTYFQAHKVIDGAFMKKLDGCINLAPLHVPHTQKEIINLVQILPQARLIAVSDSAFHLTLPDHARLYSLPKKDSKDLDIYRFGYHGLSVASVLRRFKGVTGHDPKRVIVCHIGSGVSVTATLDGKSIDTTMGYSPSSGLIMGSRAGEVDTGALLSIMQLKHLKPLDAQVYIQTNGGLRGLSGETDLRLILDRRARGDREADQAISNFVYQIKKSIGAYVATLNGLDTLVFTATAGERSSTLRSLIMDNMDGLGLKLDEDKNSICLGRDGEISQTSSTVKVFVIKTDEENEILYASQGV